jgi:hypothetical protein
MGFGKSEVAKVEIENEGEMKEKLMVEEV